jgi:hypothetical protein
MSRQLPTHPDLDHLKKQAKDLLGHLRRQNPAAQLTDAQHALAREYGFSSWAKLRAQVASPPPSGDATVVDEPDSSPQEPSPFAGSWVANLSKSRRHPSHQFQRATLEISVAGNIVTILDSVTDETGREERRTNTLEADGMEHRSGCNGYVLMARWRGPRMLETMATKDGKVVGRGSYEVSADDATLTASGDKQRVVFDRA